LSGFPSHAAHKLVTSHLRLVTKIARDYRGYGLAISEAISEGNVGLMQAVERFEPEKGFRFATYAMWWIKAAIQEYIQRSRSLVKMCVNDRAVPADDNLIERCAQDALARRRSGGRMRPGALKIGAEL
jgi:RNA polymerase sigma-32 factor